MENKKSQSEQPSPQRVEENGWDTPAFRNETLWSLVFVTLPAIIMAALGEYLIAAAWFGVGVSVIAFESRRQIRSFWRSLRSGQHTGSEKDEQG